MWNMRVRRLTVIISELKLGTSQFPTPPAKASVGIKRTDIPIEIGRFIINVPIVAFLLASAGLSRNVALAGINQSESALSPRLTAAFKPRLGLFSFFFILFFLYQTS